MNLYRSKSTVYLVALVALGVFLAAGCGHGSSPEQPAPLPPQIELTILSTNDFHGALESSSNDRNTGRPIGGAEFLAAVIDRERAENPDGTLVLDGGDMYQGTALSNLTDGRATMAFMNAVGYDAAALGNHEFDWGVSTLIDRIEQAEFPCLAANIFVKDTGERPPWAKPYVIVERQGLRIAIVGFITTSTPSTTMPQNVAPYEFPDPAPIANEIIAELVPDHADVAVIVSHIGGFQDRDGNMSGHLLDLANETEGEIAVIGGHTHRRVDGVLDDGTAILEAGSSGRNVAKATMIIDTASMTATDVSTEMITVFADDIEPNAKVASMVQQYREEIAPILDEVIAEAAVDLSAQRDECPMGNYICDAMVEATGVDMAFQNPGGVRASIPAGPVKFSDVYRVMPFDNTIVRVDLSGTEVKALLEESVGDGSFLHVSGLKYRAEYALPEGSRITEVTLSDGSPVVADATYSAVVNNFMAQGGDSLPTVTERDHAEELGILVRDAIANAMRATTAAGQPVTATIEGRVVRVRD